MIILVADHRGYALKEEIKVFYKENIITIDVGLILRQRDYPDFARLANKRVLEIKQCGHLYLRQRSRMSISANRTKD